MSYFWFWFMRQVAELGFTLAIIAIVCICVLIYGFYDDFRRWRARK